MGETAGFQFASGLKQGADAVQEAARQTADMAGAWFRDESDMVARPEELGEFSDSVDGLSDAIERLEARIRNLTGKEA